MTIMRCVRVRREAEGGDGESAIRAHLLEVLDGLLLGARAAVRSQRHLFVVLGLQLLDLVEEQAFESGSECTIVCVFVWLCSLAALPCGPSGTSYLASSCSIWWK